MSVLVMVRHGQSLWNLENRFTGSVDVPLTEKGVLEAKQAGALLDKYTFDVAYCSFLTRAVVTLETMVRTMGMPVPVIPVIRLKDFNERSYGELEGLKKDAVREKYGPEIYRLWHRGYEIAPPGGESLKQAAARVWGAYCRTVAGDLAAGKNVLLVAHGNVLRVLMMHLDEIDAAAIGTLEIPTAEPIVYHFDAWRQVMDKKILSWEKMGIMGTDPVLLH
ncbi:MAG: 2,3-diphosphoglycerate-dependent phosphoglycerate mutase [Pseudomonadota bacterium]|nr:2,3-diphosphoglycerate-dependent phosphoglycerate mutase [Pseudomonadota bacterium]